MEVAECIKKRRSIREYADKKVPEKLLYELIEAGRWAPSAGNIQSTRYIIVKDRKRLKKLSEAAFGQEWIENAAAVIAICSIKEAIEQFYGERSSLYSIQNTALAAQNIMLRATSLGLGTCFVAAFDEKYAKEILNIPPEVDLHILITVGYPKENPAPPKRLSLRNLIYFEKWGNSEKPKRRILKKK